MHQNSGVSFQCLEYGPKVNDSSHVRSTLRHHPQCLIFSLLRSTSCLVRHSWANRSWQRSPAASPTASLAGTWTSNRRAQPRARLNARMHPRRCNSGAVLFSARALENLSNCRDSMIEALPAALCTAAVSGLVILARPVTARARLGSRKPLMATGPVPQLRNCTAAVRSCGAVQKFFRPGMSNPLNHSPKITVPRIALENQAIP